MEKYQFTDKELSHLDKLEYDLIIMLFDCKDKRYVLRRIIKKAYLMGREMNTDIDLSKIA